MGKHFQVGITRDFIGPDDRMTYKDIGLGLLDAEPSCVHHFFEEGRSPVAPSQIAECDAVLSLTPTWNTETFAQGAGRLLIVARFGVGYDMCDVDALTANDVLLTITPGATDQPVAGGVLAMMLALSRRLFAKDRLVREGRWHERANYMGTDIAGKTLGIVGFGGAGTRLRQLVQAFGMNVIAYDPFVPDSIFEVNRVHRSPSLEQLFEVSDYVSIHCLLNDSTRHLIDRRLFERMKPTAYFINAARGPIVKEEDLVEALWDGRIAGAGIDVFEEEPPAEDNPLLSMENVILAPHAVCWTDECFAAIGESAVRSILSVKHGEAPYGLLNPEVLARKGFLEKRDAMLRRLG
jgi:Phosphoglycerate dehydrogenase and related dehydrogenases